MIKNSTFGLFLLKLGGLYICDPLPFPAFLEQSDPTDLTGYVSLFLSRTGICMPVRLELYRHTYACTTGVIQAYVCLCDSGYTGIRTSTNEYSVKLFWPLIG